MRIEKDNIVIRSAKTSDAKRLTDWWNDGKVMEHAGFSNGVGVTEEETLENIKGYEGNRSQLCIIEIDGIPVGELSYRIKNDGAAYPGWKICNEEYQNRGYGPKIILTLFEFLFRDDFINTPLPIDKIKWDTMLTNERAMHVYEHKIGAKKTSIVYKAWKDQLGNWRDAAYFEISRDDFYKLHGNKAVKNEIMDDEGFDVWAPTYDESVSKSESENRYPFAAYTDVMEEVNRQLEELSGKEILDMGIGTGKNTSKLYEKGYRVTGTDFSREMLEIAKEKMPNAKLIKFNFNDELTSEISKNRYDAILFTYSIHHLILEEKKSLIKKLYPLLKEGGKIIIGDVMTGTESEMKAVQEKDQDIWDDSEHYVIVEELIPLFPNRKLSFYPKSYCSGVLVIQ